MAVSKKIISDVFHGLDDAKEIWAASRHGFGGNADLERKCQKAVLKQQFEAFTISSKESLEKGYDRFQKLLSQLDTLGASVSDEDANHKFLRSLPLAWDSLANEIEERKKPKHLQASIRPSLSSGSYSSYTTSSSKASPTATPGLADEVIHSFLATNADDVDLIHEDLDQIDDLDLEEMDINWQIAMTAIKIKKFYKNDQAQMANEECKFKGSKEGNRQEAGKGQNFKPVQIEKEALMTIDEGQINWVEQTTDEELNHALMAFTVNNEVTIATKRTQPQSAKPHKQLPYKIGNQGNAKGLSLGASRFNTGKNMVVLTSAGCVWRQAIPLSNTNSGPTPDSNVNDHPLKHMEHRGIFDSGCSGHMTGNRAHLEDYQELSKVGSVTFGGSKGSISGKGLLLEICGGKRVYHRSLVMQGSQQNGVAERMNWHPFIEAAWTMLGQTHITYHFLGRREAVKYCLLIPSTGKGDQA
ncbi:hypothetical protein Tco_0230818 [Tanacetum coccineum]